MSEKINKLYITSGEATLLVESENSAILSDLQNEAFVRSHIPSAIISTETLEKVVASQPRLAKVALDRMLAVS